MKKLLLILFILPCLLFGQDSTYVKKGDGFKYTLKCTQINDSIYDFSIVGCEFSYDSFTKQKISFCGSISDEGINKQPYHFTLSNSLGVFNDEGRLSDGFPLYYEGEEPCNINFLFKKGKVVLIDKNCTGIYGGAGIDFGGEYFLID